MTARSTFVTSINNNHTTAEVGGVASTSLPSAPTPPGNATTWSHQSAVAAYSSGAITQKQFAAVMTAIAAWEQEQRNIAHDTLRASDTDIV